MAIERMSFKQYADTQGLIVQEQHTFNKLIAYGTLIMACISFLEQFQNIYIQKFTSIFIVLLVVLIFWTIGAQIYDYHKIKKQYNKYNPHKIV